MTDHNSAIEPLDSLLRALKTDALEAIQRCRSSFSKSAKTHNEKVYETIAFISAFVAHLKTSAKDRNSFLKHRHWPKEKTDPKGTKIGILATMFVLDIRDTKESSARYEQARTYWKAVKHFVEEGSPPRLIVETLRKKTLYRLLDEIRLTAEDEDGCSDIEDEAGVSSELVKAKAATNIASVHEQVSEAGIFEDEQPLGEQVSKPMAKPPLSQLVADARRLVRFNQATDLAVDAQGFFNPIMKLDVEDEVAVIIRRLPDDERQWRRFKIVRLA